MLKLHVPEVEWFDEATETFIQTKPGDLMLEHSLLSLSKWEAKWKKPFLDASSPRSDAEFLDYIRCMTINQGVDSMTYANLTPDLIETIKKYIDDPMTATTVRRHQNKRPTGKKVITSELIYSWMVHYGIPFECQKWHLNRLMMLIEVCSVESGGQGKMSKAEIMKENASLNAMRKAQRKTKG